jgi:hypothetical protein
MAHERHCKHSAVLGWLAPALAAGLLAAAPAQSPRPAVPADVGLVPADAAVVLGFRPADLWAGDFTKPVREKMAKDVAEAAAALEKLLGSRPEQIERLTLTVLSFGPGTEVTMVTLKKPYDRGQLVKHIAGAKAKEEKYKGRTLYIGEGGDAVCLLDERTYIVAKADPLRGLLDRPAKEKDGPLSPARQALAGQHDFVLGINLPAFLEQIGADLPGELEPFKPLLLAQTSVLTADAGPPTHADAVLTFADPAGARKAEKAAREGLDMARGGITAGRVALAKQPAALKLLDVAEAVVKGTKVEVDGNSLKARATAQVEPLALASAVADTLRKPGAARGRAQSVNNLKQIAIAMHNYLDAYKRFPAAAIYDKSGKPLLSWRVLILPFLGQNALYKQFHLDEPWDSPHNKKLLDKIPPVYQTPGEEKPTGRTHYQGFHGKGAFFEGKKGIGIAEITDGTSNTILVVEAAESVPWTKPQDLPFDPDKPLPKLGGLFEGGFNAAMCDGSVRFVSQTIKPETLHLAIQRNDGQPLPEDF